LLVVQTLLVASFILLLMLCHEHDLLVELVLLLAHFVDASNKVNVVLHETCVVLAVLLKVARQLPTVVPDVGLVG